MLGGDQTMIDILFDASIADVLESLRRPTSA